MLHYTVHIANRCFWMLPFATFLIWNGSDEAKYLADMRVKVLTL